MSKVLNIAVLKGDGIGVEVVDEALKVLKALSEKLGFDYKLEEALIGGAAYDATGTPLPKDTLDKCKASDAVLFGAIGGPKWESIEKDKRPEAGLLSLRKELGLFANIRPAFVYDELVNASPVKKEVVQGVDLVIVRELISGIYFGTPRGIKKLGRDRYGFNTMGYKESEIRNIAHVAFKLAMTRDKRVTSVDKANVLEVSELWREVVIEVSKEYPEVKLDHLYVDNASMQLIRAPKSFDVVVTNNMFGDILSDEASQLTGSIGLLPSSSIGSTTALFEPIHGSAPDIAGKNIANPIACILSLSMLLDHLKVPLASKLIKDSIKQALKEGVRSSDLASFDAKVVLGTKELGSLLCENIKKL
ncbi:3-isopropylmalate dehydrogenase [Helicobacter sp. 13S00401-1]|uniref:3-isopropylmalate dehydrogenase n=1 Tax=Helicobacter sp. 13S00401-1 TaxID=1905758 RepID=UPI000BA57A9C|nr:3-isopropylmalate dehydrogenase [Helicobacter sp. 13S00401-1]PAF51125.1 3-isopropylmalate dehydrogenase [Helicobacter sp. 13S00401-1]